MVHGDPGNSHESIMRDKVGNLRYVIQALRELLPPHAFFLTTAATPIYAHGSLVPRESQTVINSREMVTQ